MALAVALLLPGFDDITTTVAVVSDNDDDEWEGVDLKKIITKSTFYSHIIYIDFYSNFQNLNHKIYVQHTFKF